MQSAEIFLQMRWQWHSPPFISPSILQFSFTFLYFPKVYAMQYTIYLIKYIGRKALLNWNEFIRYNSSSVYADSFFTNSLCTSYKNSALSYGKWSLLKLRKKMMPKINSIFPRTFLKLLLFRGNLRWMRTSSSWKIN